MTDESNLTPAKPVAPRRRLPANPRMAQPMNEPAAARTSQPDPEPEQTAPEREPLDAPPAEAFTPVQPVIEIEPDPEPEAVPPAAPLAPAAPAVPAAPPAPAAPLAPAGAASETAVAEEPQFDFPRTMRDTLARVDHAWQSFRGAATRYPSEHMDDRLSEDGWTRKQMLEHIAAWHDLTADRLVKMINTGQPEPLDRDTDQFNAAVARRAVGKTSGEVLKDMDATFNRLRRQMARLTDVQLASYDWWAAWVIGGNTYGHYEEHWAEIYTPELPPGGRARR